MNNINLASFNWVDYGILSIIAASTVISLIRGFVREAISLATWASAIFVAIKFSPLLGAYFENYINNPTVRVGVAFLVLLLAVFLCGTLINYLVSTLVDKTGLSGTDRVLGIVFGTVRGVLLVAVLIVLGSIASLTQAPWWQQSQLIPQFNGLAAWLEGFVPEQMRKVQTQGVAQALGTAAVQQTIQQQTQPQPQAAAATSAGTQEASQAQDQSQNVAPKAQVVQ